MMKKMIVFMLMLFLVVGGVMGACEDECTDPNKGCNAAGECVDKETTEDTSNVADCLSGENIKECLSTATWPDDFQPTADQWKELIRAENWNEIPDDQKKKLMGNDGFGPAVGLTSFKVDEGTNVEFDGTEFKYGTQTILAESIEGCSVKAGESGFEVSDCTKDVEITPFSKMVPIIKGKSFTINSEGEVELGPGSIYTPYCDGKSYCKPITVDAGKVTLTTNDKGVLTGIRCDADCKINTDGVTVHDGSDSYIVTSNGGNVNVGKDICKNTEDKFAACGTNFNVISSTRDNDNIEFKFGTNAGTVELGDNIRIANVEVTRTKGKKRSSLKYDLNTMIPLVLDPEDTRYAALKNNDPEKLKGKEPAVFLIDGCSAWNVKEATCSVGNPGDQDYTTVKVNKANYGVHVSSDPVKVRRDVSNVVISSVGECWDCGNEAGQEGVTITQNDGGNELTVRIGKKGLPNNLLEPQAKKGDFNLKITTSQFSKWPGDISEETHPGSSMYFLGEKGALVTPNGKVAGIGIEPGNELSQSSKEGLVASIVMLNAGQKCAQDTSCNKFSGLNDYAKQEMQKYYKGQILDRRRYFKTEDSAFTAWVQSNTDDVNYAMNNDPKFFNLDLGYSYRVVKDGNNYFIERYEKKPTENVPIQRIALGNFIDHPHNLKMIFLAEKKGWKDTDLMFAATHKKLSNEAEDCADNDCKKEKATETPKEEPKAWINAQNKIEMNDAKKNEILLEMPNGELENQEQPDVVLNRVVNNIKQGKYYWTGGNNNVKYTGENAEAMRRNDVRILQWHLSQQKKADRTSYYDGDTDGVYDEDFHKVVQQWQEDQKNLAGSAGGDVKYACGGRCVTNLVGSVIGADDKKIENAVTTQGGVGKNTDAALVALKSDDPATNSANTAVASATPCKNNDECNDNKKAIPPTVVNIKPNTPPPSQLAGVGSPQDTDQDVTLLTDGKIQNFGDDVVVAPVANLNTNTQVKVVSTPQGEVMIPIGADVQDVTPTANGGYEIRTSNMGTYTMTDGGVIISPTDTVKVDTNKIPNSRKVPVNSMKENPKITNPTVQRKNQERGAKIVLIGNIKKEYGINIPPGIVSIHNGAAVVSSCPKTIPTGADLTKWNQFKSDYCPT